MSRDGTVSAGANGPAVVFGKRNRDHQGPQPASEGGQGENSASINDELFGGGKPKNYYKRDFAHRENDFNNRLWGHSNPDASHNHMNLLSEHVKTGGIQEEHLSKGHNLTSFNQVKRQFDRANRPPLGKRIMGFLRGNPPVPENTALQGVSMRSVMEEHIHKSILENQQNIAKSLSGFERDNKYLSNRTQDDLQDYQDGVEPDNYELKRETRIYRDGKRLGNAKLSYDHDRLRNMSDEEVYDYAVSTGIMHGDNLEKAAAGASFKQHGFRDREEYPSEEKPWGGFGSDEPFTEKHREDRDKRMKFVRDRNDERGQSIAMTMRSWMT